MTETTRNTTPPILPYVVSGELTPRSWEIPTDYSGRITLDGVSFQVSTRARTARDKTPYLELSGISDAGERIRGALFTFDINAETVAARRPCMKGKVNRGAKAYHVAGWIRQYRGKTFICLGENKRKAHS